jgi:hypothetical protein
MSHFGAAGWKAVTEDYKISFIINGSGINNMSWEGIKHLDWNFIYKKYLVWYNVGFNYAFIGWAVFLSFPIVIFRFIDKKYRVLLIGLYVGSVVSFLWYLLFSSMGWGRHIWQGLMIGMMLVSICLASIFVRIKNIKIRLVSIVLFVISGWVIFNPNVFDGRMFFNEKTIQHWREVRVITGLNGFPSNDTFSLTDEQNLIQFFSTHIHMNDRIYYVGWFLNAEVSPLVDKVFYPLGRYFTLQQKNPDGGESYVIFGHYQMGAWAFESASYMPEKTTILCKDIVYKNPTYLLCTLRQSIVYSNPAF